MEVLGIDHALMFDHSLACAIFSFVKEAFIAISIPIFIAIDIKIELFAPIALFWVDDDMFGRDPILGSYPYRYKVQLKDIMDVAEKLSITLSPESVWTSYSPCNTCMGHLWHFDEKRVEVPEVKKKNT
jgi:hypothetical protein